MKTTRRQAELILDIANWVDPYEVCIFDKKTYIKDLMSTELEENLKELNGFISEKYGDEASEILNNSGLLIRLSRLYKNIESEKYKTILKEKPATTISNLPF